MANSNISAPARQRDRLGLLFLISAVVIVLDRITKHAVEHAIPLGEAHVVVPGVFRITHVFNSGAAFSLFGDTASPERVRWMLVAFSLIAAAAIVVALVRLGRRINSTTLGLALILGGALSNAWDRIHRGVVTDFLEVHIVHYHWPDFNMADSCIVVGGILLVLHALVAREE